MLKKFLKWFIIFGLSFLVSNVFGWTEQGKAFLYIDLIIMCVIFFISLVIAITIKHAESAVIAGASFVTVLIIAVIVAIELLATWGATKLFNVDFFVAYQIMTFGQCLWGDTNKKKDD